MLFGRNRKSDSQKPAPREERRRKYRITKSKSHPVRVTLTFDGADVTCEFLDLTASGVGVRVMGNRDPNLRVGDVAELMLATLARDEVRSPARVVHIKRDPDLPTRYGFEFINVGNLYSQLDNFYARLFNRRRALRVRPALDKKLAFHLTWPGQELKASVFNISQTGVGLSLPPAEAQRLDGVDEVEVRFRLPGMTEDMVGRAYVKNRTTLTAQVIVGLLFDFESSDQLGGHKKTLDRYIADRMAEIAKWEAAAVA